MGQTAVERWLHHCTRKGLRPVTMEHYRARMGWLESWAVKLDKDLLELTTEDIEQWLDGKTITPRSRLSYGTTVKVFYRWAEDEGLVARSPGRRLVLPRVPPGRPRPLADDDLARAIAEAGPHLRVALLLGALAGLRAGEIARLRVEDVDFSGRLLHIDGKGGRGRVVPLHRDLEKALRGLPMPRRGQVLAGWGRLPARPTLVTQRIGCHFERLGIPGSAHSLRHFFATRTYEHAVDIRVVSELLGHASPRTTLTYARWEVNRARPAVDALVLP